LHQLQAGSSRYTPHHPQAWQEVDRKIWREENMCCICHICHKDGQTVWMRVQLLKTMQRLYGYDMEWAKDEVVMEEVA